MTQYAPLYRKSYLTHSLQCIDVLLKIDRLFEYEISLKQYNNNMSGVHELLSEGFQSESKLTSKV